MRTPWGLADQIDKLIEGVFWVSTPSHGGLMIEKKVAERLLSKHALDKGLVFGKYYCYEEDCLYAIPMYELPQIRREITEDILLATLSCYYPDYLRSIRVRPKPNEHIKYLARELSYKLQREKSPLLVVSAIRIDDKTTKVTTADNKEYLVTSESYHKCVFPFPAFLYQLTIIKRQDQHQE